MGEQKPAAECCLVLLLPVGARAVALGRALTGGSSPDAVFANPAGLAGLQDDHLVVHHNTLAAQATAFSILATPRGVGTLGLSYELLDFGDIEYTDGHGQTTGMLSLRHHVLIGSFATELVGGLAAGFNYKLYQFRLSCHGNCGGQEVGAVTHAVDAGLRYHPPLLPALEFGVMVANLGFPLQVVNAQQADPLPGRIRVGAAYEVLHHLRPESAMALSLAMDLEDQWQDPGSPSPSLGLELAADNTIFLRAGYVPGEGIGTGAAVGIGIHYASFTISVAKSFVANLLDSAAEPVQVSFGLHF